MKILVPVKQVAVLDEDFELREDGRDVDPDYLNHELNEWDDYSWEVALQLQERHGAAVEVVPVTVGPTQAEEGLRKCLAKGGERGIRVWDAALAGSDPTVIARLLARLAEREGADLVLTGAQAADHAYAQTGVGVAALLGWPHVAVVSALDYTPGAASAKVCRELEGGLQEELAVQMPAVLTIQLGINEPRYASLRGIKQASAKPIEVLSHRELGLSDAQVGEAGSACRVRRMYVPAKGQAELIEGTPAEQARRLAEIINELRGVNG
ncbi:MAG TPA: electron transfer flavoprotein subunit beta/FixA family protein [Nevskiales bacterium]|nr:electron transfer flavoprotein subunit beta/FixA family protein [Nevskiales bacterium]